MNFIQYITMILLSLTPSYGDSESWTERTARMEIIASAIDDAASRATCVDKYLTLDCKKAWPLDKKSLALLLVTKGYWESAYAKNVHEGKCHRNECDSYTANGRVIHKARSPWQIQKTGLVTKDEYAQMNSSTLEATTMSANVATRHLVLGWNSCKTIRGAMAIYGGAKSCNWKGVIPREAFYKSLMTKNEGQIFSIADAQKIKLESRLEKSFPVKKSNK